MPRLRLLRQFKFCGVAVQLPGDWNKREIRKNNYSCDFVEIVLVVYEKCSMSITPALHRLGYVARLSGELRIISVDGDIAADDYLC